MSSSLRQMLGHSFIFIVFDGINKAIPFLLLPYLTHRLATTEFGLLELFNTYVALLVLLIMFGVDGWCSAHFHKLERDVFAGLLRVGLSSIAAVFAVSMFAMLFIADDPRFIFAPLYALGMCLIQIRAILYRFELKTIKASILLFLNVSVSSLLTIGAFELMTPGLTWRLVALLLPVVCLGCFSCYSVCRQFPASSASNGGVRTLWKFTLPLLPNGLINFVRFGADRFFVAHTFGIVNLAIFSVGYQLSMVVNIFMLSLNQATMPYVMRLLAVEDKKNVKRVFLFQLLLLVFFIVVFSIMLPYIVKYLFSPEYIESKQFTLIYIFSYPFVFISIMLSNILFIKGKTIHVLISTTISSLAHISGLVCILFFEEKMDYVPYVSLLSAAVSLIITVLFIIKINSNEVNIVPK
ncbi:lipopolysaccharide biosynthesis protein [Aeromonas caviae]|uniref:lipopolysaccharide biosynthesis protein n=1 Tax=Aeromonas caviae TaxID=648 RepID=UPI0020B70B30|nr:MATE family efflux transporter [Aeromonas caviae]UTI01320.1 MATE family efflux transporter [Aeromonas caviae]